VEAISDLPVKAVKRSLRHDDSIIEFRKFKTSIKYKSCTSLATQDVKLILWAYLRFGRKVRMVV
jgi:hypothetical protein